MPEIEVVIFVEHGGSAPLLEWLDNLPPKVRDKFTARIELLAQRGHELRRPLAAFLGDNVYELRVRHMQVNYRILYFFHEGRAILSHGLEKGREVPKSDIQRVLRRREEFDRDPEGHAFEG